MKHIFLLLCLLVAICSCKQKNNETTEIIVVNVAKDYPSKNIFLQDIADIEYIPIASSDSFLVNSSFSQISEEGIVARGGKAGEILLFDNKGQKLQGHICRRGQGPEEYTAVIANIVDWKRKEVFIADYGSLKVYDFSGNYLRTLLKEDIMRLNIKNLNENYLLCSYNNEYTTTPYRPFYTISKDTGKSDTLSFEIPRFIASNRHVTMEDGKVSHAHGYLPQIYSCSDKIWLTDVALDTVFILHADKHLEPVMIPLQAPTKDEEAPLLFFLGMNDQYAWVTRLARNVTTTMDDMIANHEKREKTYMYNRATQEWMEPIYRNKDFTSRTRDPQSINITSVPYGYGLVVLEAMDLVEAYQNNEIANEQLKVIASKLKEEDNPILMKLKFKPSTRK